jgi:hybrid cluster-associated redox disulfide protein
MKTKKEKISKSMMIGDIVDKYPKIAEKLVTEYGLHCIGCGAAGMETLEEGAMAHGLTKKDVEKMVEKLNKAA